MYKIKIQIWLITRKNKKLLKPVSKNGILNLHRKQDNQVISVNFPLFSTYWERLIMIYYMKGILLLKQVEK